MATSLFPKSTTRGCLFLLVIAVSFARPGVSSGQEASPEFNDLATRAAAARDQQNLPLAIQLYSLAEQIRPDWQEGWWYLGVLEYSSNQYAGAIDAFTHLLRLVPTAVPALALRGLCEFETAAYDDSLRDLEQAVAHGAANEPRNERIIRLHLALLLTHAGRYPEALSEYKILARSEEETPDLLAGLALAGMRIPSLPSDVGAADRPFYESAGRAGFLFLADKDERASGLFTQLFSRYPDRPGLHFFFGYLLFPHDPFLSGNQFREELAVRPAADTYALLALTLIYEGHFAEALEPAQNAYQRDPNLEMAQVALGRALAENGEIQRGTELLRQAVQNDSNDLEAHLGLASIYSRSGDREEEARERRICRELAK